MTKESSKVVTGEPVKNHKVKTMLVDEYGVDMEQMVETIKRQNEMIDRLTQVVRERDEEDAEITRRLIMTKTAKWQVPMTMDELVEFSKDELDDLHKYISRIGRVDLREEIDEAPEATIYKAVRKFPKMPAKDNAAENYSVGTHTFKLS